MEKICILSDFDGTITVKDSLYNFFEQFAPPKWLEIEQLWEDGIIDSKECLVKEFQLIPKLTSEFLDNYLDTVTIDEFFFEFYKYIKQSKIDFYIVSDGVDYFIKKILENNNLKGLHIISNHAEFIDENFELTFPNSQTNCKKNSGTCKCAVLNKFKNDYDKIIYIGDGTSDFCVAPNTDILFAKKKLENYCQKNNIDFVSYTNFGDVINFLKKRTLL